ncbi:MAG: HipA domain-containing protein [Spirochaetes bacterium]|nr:HipA domain-containing protein [Spirochaetota bacterium]
MANGITLYIPSLYSICRCYFVTAPKCNVEWDNSLWIAKFPSKGDSVNIPVIEYASMNLAKRCGIDVPEIRVKSIADKDVFLIQRFDRNYSVEWSLIYWYGIQMIIPEIMGF